MDPLNQNVPLLIDHAKVARTSMDMCTSPGRPKDQQIADLMWAQANWLAALYPILSDIRDLMKINAS